MKEQYMICLSRDNGKKFIQMIAPNRFELGKALLKLQEREDWIIEEILIFKNLVSILDLDGELGSGNTDLNI